MPVLNSSNSCSAAQSISRYEVTAAIAIWFSLTLCLILLLPGCGVGGSSMKSAPPPPGPNAIPASFWGVHVNRVSSFPVQVPYGEFRFWDTTGAQWPDIETCQASSSQPTDPCFVWDTFDVYLNNLHNAGVTDVMYTLSRTPIWAVNLVSDPTGLGGTDCDYYLAGSLMQTRAPGQCLVPVDVNADGSGADQIWKNWVTAIATHANDATYLQTHAHIKYWEPWNEFSRGTILNPGYVGTLSFQGTYAQLVRLTEDMRCTITGTGTIHNYPQAGQSTPCSATAIDSTALVVSPSGAASYQGGLNVMRNFLYCNGTGAGAPALNSDCSTGNAASQAVDVINFHLYAEDVTPEKVAGTYIPNARAILQSADLAKPMINGEGSWENPAKSSDLWADPYAQAGFIPRYFALYWSAGLTMNMWYSYDETIGELFDVSTGQLSQPAASAWLQTYTWLQGATPKNNPFCTKNGTVYTCDFTEASGKSAELVWDAQYGQNCSQQANPVICGATPYDVPASLNQDWLDVTGTSNPPASTVTIGANPILLEGP
jgi:hypothetical protein